MSFSRKDSEAYKKTSANATDPRAGSMTLALVAFELQSVGKVLDVAAVSSTPLKTSHNRWDYDHSHKSEPGEKVLQSFIPLWRQLDAVHGTTGLCANSFKLRMNAIKRNAPKVSLSMAHR